VARTGPIRATTPRLHVVAKLCSLYVLCGRHCREERGAATADQIIDAAMVRGLHADACRTRALVGWVVLRDPPDYPDRVIAGLVTEARPYLLVADALAGIHAQLPPRLARGERRSPEVMEIWFAS
jgi:hypothetical protein